jgi:hypothetical protein
MNNLLHRQRREQKHCAEGQPGNAVFSPTIECNAGEASLGVSGSVVNHGTVHQGFCSPLMCSGRWSLPLTRVLWCHDRVKPTSGSG